MEKKDKTLKIKELYIFPTWFTIRLESAIIDGMKGTIP